MAVSAPARGCGFEAVSEDCGCCRFGGGGRNGLYSRQQKRGERQGGAVAVTQYRRIPVAFTVAVSVTQRFALPVAGV